MTDAGPLRPEDAAAFNAIGEGRLPGLLGVEIVSAEPGAVVARMQITEHHLAPNGFLHAASVVALADTACGYGCVRSRTTQLWDATVQDEASKVIAMFRCTQLVLQPRP